MVNIPQICIEVVCILLSQRHTFRTTAYFSTNHLWNFDDITFPSTNQTLSCDSFVVIHGLCCRIAHITWTFCCHSIYELIDIYIYTPDKIYFQQILGYCITFDPYLRCRCSSLTLGIVYSSSMGCPTHAKRIKTNQFSCCYWIFSNRRSS